jgi:hypothetical protein
MIDMVLSIILMPNEKLSRSVAIGCIAFVMIFYSMLSLIAARIVSTDGAFVSLPDLSLNILHENPTVP